MTPDYVDRLLDQYDEWHESYLRRRQGSDASGVEESWTAFRVRLRNHLLRAPGRKADGPFDPRITRFHNDRADDPRALTVNEEIDTRKQEL